jgi:D-glycero-alpha-D-manno-heptose 1-phosphate guanylyltransferase
MIKEAIVLAGGFGTRLREVVNDVPKPMAPVNGRPFLEYILDYLHHYGVTRVILSVGYKGEMIREHFGDTYSTMSIGYAFEHEPLGTGGAIKLGMELCDSKQAAVLNGDTLFDINLTALYAFHKEKGAGISLALRQLEDVSRYGTVKIDEDHRIKGFAEKSAAAGSGYINGGVYLFNKEIFTDAEFPQKFSIEKDLFERYYESLRMYGFVSHDYFIDIGIPDDYHRAQHELKNYEL